jgi:hypothetical protein
MIIDLPSLILLILMGTVGTAIGTRFLGLCVKAWLHGQYVDAPYIIWSLLWFCVWGFVLYRSLRRLWRMVRAL